MSRRGNPSPHETRSMSKGTAVAISLAAAAMTVAIAIENFRGEPEPGQDSPAAGDTSPERKPNPKLQDGVLHVDGRTYRCVTKQLVETEQVEDDNGNVTKHMSSSLPSNKDFAADQESCRDNDFEEADPSYLRIVDAASQSE